MATPLLLAVLLVNCMPSNQQQRNANKALVRQFAATIDASEWEALDALVTEDLRRHSQATTLMPEITSRDPANSVRSMAPSRFVGWRVIRMREVE